MKLQFVGGVVILLATLFILRLRNRGPMLETYYSYDRGETGIPGLSTWYEGHLSNRGWLPVRIQVCDFVDDTRSKGQVPAYAVQRLDTKTQQWITLADLADTRVCHPYPLGWHEAHLKMAWLWPAREVATGEEITAGRGFRKGESGRFVLYKSFHLPGKASSLGFATLPFTIDEQIQDDPSKFRVKH